MYCYLVHVFLVSFGRKIWQPGFVIWKEGISIEHEMETVSKARRSSTICFLFNPFLRLRIVCEAMPCRNTLGPMSLFLTKCKPFWKHLFFSIEYNENAYEVFDYGIAMY
jgi:hypothetical protein